MTKSPEQIRNKFHAPSENYQRFTEDQAIDGKGWVWTKDKVLSHYVTLTDRMVGILDGSSPQKVISIDDDGNYNSFNAEQGDWKPQEVLYLAKSAAPVEALVDAMWEQMAAEGAEKPHGDMLAIDRRDFLSYMGVTNPYDQDDSTSKKIDISKIPQELISRIRAYFVEGDIDMDNWQEDVWSKPTRLDGRNVLVVDEVKNSGATMEIAMKMIKAAVPEADIKGTYFWDKTNSVPIWYPPKKPGKTGPVGGRLVAPPDPKWWDKMPEGAEKKRRKLAAFVLPTPFHNTETMEPVRDLMSDQLAQDIAYMTYDYADGKILNNPIDRSDDEWAEALAKQGITPEDLRQFNDKGGFGKP